MKPNFGKHMSITEEDKEQLEFIQSKRKITTIAIFRRGLLELMKEVKEEGNT